MSAPIGWQFLSEVGSDNKSTDKSSRLSVIIFTQPDFYVSHMQHLLKLKRAIEEKFGKLVEVLRGEATSNAEFDVCIRVSGRGVDGFNRKTSQSLASMQVLLSQQQRSGLKVTQKWAQDKLLFCKLREGFFATEEALLPLIDLSLRSNRVVARELSKVECVCVFSRDHPDFAHIFRSLLGHVTSQLIDHVNFKAEAIDIPDVFEIWINGYLTYSLWSCRELPVLLDIITELHRAAEGRPINTMPKIKWRN